ncbi:alpha/beta hydrolase [Rathayibacter iranicus]|uniref:Alpha/beta hydrolase n=2 Tax=Rathayibacter iranicus TaxID=59737 RepID=A0AAD2JFR5_9MICO|nr:alpha/beta hydrolase [Rathayibacter iranicus]AZZ54467.1 alpha/beta hydrolase [Rathayibacter iranicus]MWV29884.1 alpha/beta fold hydrolase [Rathayibacter iranicus NCPPB 2253 = VKM Ac-1602]PPI51642.1 alpha/beta hydrolase [Rathayibacter iranicus]PPI63810.1 alpha/beta hydrolase [Rathayibacter iranicus]PPI74656.1 alpha/beta hydrolase [Rathayibacter iranicus]
MTRAHRSWALAALVVVVSLLTACFTTGSTVATTSTPAPQSVDADLARYYSQVLVWDDCGGGAFCADATVPLDWDNPAGDTASIALVRRPATEGPALGSLLMNPGGPGGSGVDFIRKSASLAVDTRLAARYDVVGFDPRGVGASTAVSCLDAAGLDSYLYDITPGERGSDEWIQAQRTSAAAFAAGCEQRSGPLLPEVGTPNAARDLDVLRAALGDERLNYFGYSYGTYLGATYAGLFPERVGRLVLDGAIDPAATSFDVLREQAKGFERALRAYLADCLGSSGCPFTGSVDEAMTQLHSMLAQVDESPIRANDGRKLGANTLWTAIIYPLYDANGWRPLSEMLSDVRRGGAEIAFQYADAYNSRSAKGTYSGNSTEAFLAINCMDYSFNADTASMRADAAALEEAAPTVGRYLAYGDIACGEWPVASQGSRAPIRAEGAAPILVVGTTKDPATPYIWAQALAGQLADGHLITYNGQGHTAYNKSNSCVNDAVDAYLIDGTVPEEDPQC